MYRVPLIAAAVVGAVAAVVTPVVIGLSGNPSFSEQLPVHLPRQARLATLADNNGSASDGRRLPSPLPATGTRIARSDDGARHDVGDDNPSGEHHGRHTAGRSGRDDGNGSSGHSGRGGGHDTSGGGGDDRGGDHGRR